MNEEGWNEMRNSSLILEGIVQISSQAPLKYHSYLVHSLVRQEWGVGVREVYLEEL